jgi:hypothetical protein
MASPEELNRKLGQKAARQQAAKEADRADAQAESEARDQRQRQAEEVIRTALIPRLQEYRTALTNCGLMWWAIQTTEPSVLIGVSFHLYEKTSATLRTPEYVILTSPASTAPRIYSVPNPKEPWKMVSLSERLGVNSLDRLDGTAIDKLIEIAIDEWR